MNSSLLCFSSNLTFHRFLYLLNCIVCATQLRWLLSTLPCLMHGPGSLSPMFSLSTQYDCCQDFEPAMVMTTLPACSSDLVTFFGRLTVAFIILHKCIHFPLVSLALSGRKWSLSVQMYYCHTALGEDKCKPTCTFP